VYYTAAGPGGILFCGLLKEMKGLKTLKLGDSAVTAKGLEELKKALPGAKIEQ
jgi:hypothetical protein